MSTAAISSSSTSQSLETYFQGRNSDLKQLGKDLATGNTSGAEQEYQDIVNLGQNGPVGGGNEFFNSQRQQDFNAIGQALNSGDLTGAQQSFVALKDTVTGQAPPPIAASTPSVNTTA